MTKEKFTIADKNLAIIGEAANINYFLKTELTGDSVTGVVNKQTVRKEMKVRRYVGDPAPYTVPSTAVEFMYDPGRIDLQTLPGKPFILDDGVEKRQFSYVGDVMDLHAFLVGDAAMDLKLYTVGPPYQITASGAEAAKASTRTR